MHSRFHRLVSPSKTDGEKKIRQVRNERNKTPTSSGTFFARVNYNNEEIFSGREKVNENSINKPLHMVYIIFSNVNN